MPASYLVMIGVQFAKIFRPVIHIEIGRLEFHSLPEFRAQARPTPYPLLFYPCLIMGLSFWFSLNSC